MNPLSPFRWPLRALNSLGRPVDIQATDDGKLKTDTVVTGDVTVNVGDINAELKVDSGHDLYVATNIVKDGSWTITFDSIAGLSLKNLQGVENKTTGITYFTKGATVTDTTITLVGAANPDKLPPEATDEVEVVYRGASRILPDNHQVTVSNPITGFATEAKQLADNHQVTVSNLLPDNHQVIVSNMIAAVETGLAKEAKQLADNHQVTVSNPITGFATEAKQLADNHQVTVSNMIAAVETGLAKETTFDSLLNQQVLTNETAVNTGTLINTALFKNKTAFVFVTGNTGAVTVNIEHSPNGTDWVTWISKTYTAVNESDSWEIPTHCPHMKISISSITNATVNAFLTGRSI